MLACTGTGEPRVTACAVQLSRGSEGRQRPARSLCKRQLPFAARPVSGRWVPCPRRVSAADRPVLTPLALLCSRLCPSCPCEHGIRGERPARPFCKPTRPQDSGNVSRKPQKRLPVGAIVPSPRAYIPRPGKSSACAVFPALVTFRGQRATRPWCVHRHFQFSVSACPSWPERPCFN